MKRPTRPDATSTVCSNSAPGTMMSLFAGTRDTCAVRFSSARTSEFDSGDSARSRSMKFRRADAAVTMRRLETRTSSCPVICCEMSAPTEAQSRTSPIWVAEAPRSLFTPGMAAIQVPTTAPFTTKMRKVASRGLTDAPSLGLPRATRRMAWKDGRPLSGLRHLAPRRHRGTGRG